MRTAGVDAAHFADQQAGRLQRIGTGLTERVWTFLLGLTVRP